MRLKKAFAIMCVALQFGALRMYAQEPLLEPQPSTWPSLARPYGAPSVPPIRLANSSRLHDLIRAGILYLTVQDALALAIENNLDLEIQRYEPVLAKWGLQRQQGGGPLRGASANASQVGAVVSGQGVLGSEQSAGVNTPTSGGGGGGGGGNASVQQIGTTAPNYDPTVSNSTTFSHVTRPQYNQTVSEVPALVDDTRTYQTQIQQGLQTGGLVQLSQTEGYLNENSPGDSFNPQMGPSISGLVVQPLLQGFGIGVNTYYIHVAKNNIRAAQESFRSQMLDLAANVLNLYWNVASAAEAVKAAQQALDIAQKFDDDTRQRVRIGALAGYQVPRADEELARQQQVLALARMQEEQSEQPLKDAISRGEDPELEAARIVTTDRIEVPASDDLPPLRELVAKAMTGRPDLAVAAINDENTAITSVGTTNNLLPNGGVYSRITNTGDAPGLGTAFGQVLRRDFANEYIGAYFSIPLNNRSAQSDYAIDQLQLQQTALGSQRKRNDIVAGISNQAVALKQARAGYEAAVSARELQEQLLKGEQDKFSFGSSSVDSLVLAQRALVAAQSAEVSARGSYAHARVNLDQMLGVTLEVNHLTLEEGESGHIAK
jgi:outer membrane protein